MNVVILTENDKNDDSKYTLKDERAEHIFRVLKSEVNDIIEIGLLNDKLGKAKICSISKELVELEVFDLKVPLNSFFKIYLICALPRPQTLKKVLNISATMGVNHIFLIRSEKVEKSYFHSPLLEEKRYTKYLLEGLSQGKRINIPTVSIHKKFKTFFIDEFNVGENNIKLFAHPDTDRYLSKENINSNEDIILAIGPEGGWNNYEINFMQEKGFQKFRLSENILRVESAVTASLAHIELLKKM